MKRLLPTVLILFSLAIRAGSQNPNPQSSFSSAVLSAKPSLYLNFNDFSTNFLDQISGLTFTNPLTITTGGLTNVGAISAPSGGSAGTGAVLVNNTAMPAGTLHSCSIQYAVAPTSTPTINCLQVRVTGGHASIIASWAVTPALTTAVQTFAAPGGLTTLAGDMIGTYSDSAPNLGQGGQPDAGSYYVTSSQPSGTFTLTNYSPGFALSSVVDTTAHTTYTSGTVTPRQPGFDSTQINNTSAEFPYNGFNAAPNDTLGAIDWDSPYTLMVHVDRLNWNRTGTLVLASKGDTALTNTGNWWELYLQMDGLVSQLCFKRNGYGSAPPASGSSIEVQNGICTSANFDAMPNGFNYNIMVTDTGTGASYPNCSGCTAPLSLYINGLNGTYIPETSFTNTYNNGFGYAALTITSGGMGFTGTTAFTSTGGGPNCNVSGNATESGGSLNAISIINNYGCISNPTIVLTAPTGTGGVITAVAAGTSMNSTTLPLMVPGYVNSNVIYGVAGATSSQTPTYIDEFAIFPFNLSFTQISNIFYQTKFHQEVLKTSPTPVPMLVFDDDGGGDMENFFALQMAIAIQQHGIMHLAGVVSEDESVTCEATWRQMLDQAGLNNIPVSVPSAFTSSANSGTSACTNANVAAYNASTPLSNAAWEPSTTMYRTIFAKYPTTPIDIVLGGPFTAMAEFMESPADSISPLTGLQLMAQNASNGGAIYAQGLGCTPSAYPATTPCSATITGDNSLADPVSGQYVVAHNGTTPIYWIGGTPQIAGPGVLSTRTSNDPLYLLANHEGSDTRQCYDCLAVEAAVSSYFTGGVEVGYSGGTGYATSTPFTFSGGGTNCQGTGIMTASSGVPNGIQFQWGASATSSYEGIGNGCTSTPTVNLVGATGTGVALTAYPTSVCGTYTISETGSVWSGAVTSATCSNHYFLPFSEYSNSSPASGAPMSWFINSLVDPVPGGAPRVH